MEAFKCLDLLYYNTEGSHYDTDIRYWPKNMTEMKMMIQTRPRYPSDKLTFNIANITKGKTIRFINIEFNSNATFDIDFFLEDSKRNFL